MIYLMAISDAFGGGERYLVNLAQSLLRLGRPVTIVGRCGSPFLRTGVDLGIRSIAIDAGRKLGRRTILSNVVRKGYYSRELRHWTSQLGATDVLVLQYKWEQSLLGGRMPGCRIVALEHGPIPKRLRLLPLTARRVGLFLRRAETVLAVSPAAARSVRQFCGVSAVTIQGGVDGEAAKVALERRASTREALGKTDSKIICVAGRLDPDKRVDLAMRAASLVPDSDLVIAGDGSQRRVLETLAARLGNGNRIQFLGQLKSGLDVIAAADVLLLTSRSEGRPLVIVEAAAVGTPAVATANEGTKFIANELGPDRVTLVGGANPSALAEAILGVLRRPRPAPRVVTWDHVAEEFCVAVSC